MLAQMGAALNLAPQVPISETMRELKELQVARQALITDQTRLLNRIKTQKVALVVRQGKAGSVAQIFTDCLRDSKVLVGLHEQAHTPDLPHDELARLQCRLEAARLAADLVRPGDGMAG